MNFPRPKNDNGLGMCCTQNAGDDVYEMDWMYNFISAMQDKRFKWLKLITTIDPANKRRFLARFAKDRDIMPICRPYRERPHPRMGLFPDFVRAWLDQGCVYFEVGNEPNLISESAKEDYRDYNYNGKTGVPAYAELLLDQFLREGGMIKSLGGIPLFPSMSPTAPGGGDYQTNPTSHIFHHTLYILVLEAAKARNVLHEAFDDVGVAVHNRPCNTDIDSTGRCAFGDYIWIHNKFLEYGLDLPLFGTESGYEGGMVTDYLRDFQNNLYPAPETCLQWHRTLNHEIFNRMNPNHPKAWCDYLICQCMWLAADGSWFGAGWASNGWANGGESYAWKHMKDIVPFTRWEGTPPVEPSPPPPQPPPTPTGDDEMEFIGFNLEGGEAFKNEIVISPPPNRNSP